MKVHAIDLNGEWHEFLDVDRVAYVNQETYGSPEKLEPVNDKMLVVNVNGVAAVLLDD